MWINIKNIITIIYKIIKINNIAIGIQEQYSTFGVFAKYIIINVLFTEFDIPIPLFLLHIAIINQVKIKLLSDFSNNTPYSPFSEQTLLEIVLSNEIFRYIPP